MEEPDPLEELSKRELIEKVRDLEAEKAKRQGRDKAAANTARKGILLFFIGSRLHGHTKTAFTEWVKWIQSGAKDEWPVDETGDFVASLTARFMRIGLVAVFGAIVTAIVLLTQTIILSRQNAHIERQNSFVAFEQTSKFRELLFKPPTDSTGAEVQNWEEVADSLYDWRLPDESIVDQLIELGQNETETVHSALEPLLRDPSRTVSVGAIEVLAYLDVKIERVAAQLPRARLSGASMREASLTFADLSRANLSRADLSSADLSFTDLSGGSLYSADLSDANLPNADLSGTNLSNANLSGANLSGADLSGADLSDTDLSGTDLYLTDFSGADLSLTIFSEYSNICQAYTFEEVKPDSVYAKLVQVCNRN